jgi:hypothetical protein
VRGPAIRGFPYVLLVRVPLVAHLVFVALLIRPPSAIDHESLQRDIAILGCALFMMACWLMQLIVVPIAIRASWRAHALRSWRPNLAITCGCLQIAMLVWIVVPTVAEGIA